MKEYDLLCVNTLRFLAVDAVEQANSGHSGLPLGAAPMAYVLWDRFLRHNPRNPSWKLFEEQSIKYQRQVLHPDLPKLALETGVTLGWRGFVGEKGRIIGLDRFGASAPGNIIYDKLGFNVDNIV